ncbi:glucoamylase [Stereum hirsutum FP-91666 SS1]|uniref:glucoamylase n=1 Tax=Stereum hirsutum (strain FP-91666) TaxID=721885 RepID=UPI00044496DC|nr:glucoamylase [Stereum hirsutum FP-91666 SS1]EIM83582.1 glucoamylase [Stereum hirsutum FP-91666 SS1]
MRSFTSLLQVASLCVGLVSSVWAQSSTAEAYIASESPIAKANLLANIGPSGSKSQGAKAGVVIASPSNTNPNYLFTWTRDSSLVFKAIIDQFVLGLDSSLESQIQNFVTAEQILQQVSNPSGSVSTGGLGEPKFNIDESAFTGAWGRPQRDGPALRATALITWSNWLRNNGGSSTVTGTIWPMIVLDLNYVANNWNQTTFDLWEEVSSSSFFTTSVQHRALREGIILATALGQTSNVASWTTQANNLLCFLQSFWNPTSGYITANTGGGRSGKDANTILASIHTFDPAALCDVTTFQPCSDKALANLKVYTDAFRTIYGINSAVAAGQPVATGRYPEDSYMGGNPWYLATLAVAEQLYDSLIVWNKAGNLNITSTSLPFFQGLANVGTIATGTFSSNSTTFQSVTAAVQLLADGYVDVVAKFTPSGGGLAEQYDRNTGVPVSAVDLTWSYASVLTATMARSGVVGESWGAAGLTTSCSTTGGGGGGGGGGSSGTVAVTFNVQATTVFGENIFLTGSVDQLENWSPTNAIPLSAANYPTWSVTVNLPASTSIQYKYIRINNGQVTWESDPNMQITTPSSGTFTENDTWR